MRAPATRASVQIEPPQEGGYGRWRAVSLLTVYALMAAHVVHWRLAGRTLAPLEFNEVMYTLEAGILTAGFLFMALTLGSVLLFGRFFCSWGCHILALEDGSAWLLGRVGIRPKPIRSRLLVLVPPVAFLYMFAWPHLVRLIEGGAAPAWRIMSPDDPWGSFVTDDFWRNLPGPWIAAGTFLICGFLVVYLLGSRSFCTYICPYGAAFALADRLAPGRIVRVGTDCDGCGACTAACKSNILVHEEVRVFGKVVSPACLKDLDCVAACPERALKWGLARPALFQSWSRAGRRPRRYNLSLGEELLAASMFVAGVLVFRGLYDAIPFLMSLGIGLVSAWLSVIASRLLRQSRVDLSHRSLKQRGRITRTGRLVVGLLCLLAGVLLHSAFIRWHEARGAAAFSRLSRAAAVRDHQAADALAPQVIHHLEICHRWGLVRSVELDQRLASVHEWSAEPLAAVPYLRRLIERRPHDSEAYLRLAGILVHSQGLDEAAAVLALLDEQFATRGKTPEASIRRRVQAVHVALGRRLLSQGSELEAREHFNWDANHESP